MGQQTKQNKAAATLLTAHTHPTRPACFPPFSHYELTLENMATAQVVHRQCHRPRLTSLCLVLAVVAVVGIAPLWFWPICCNCIFKCATLASSFGGDQRQQQLFSQSTNNPSPSQYLCKMRDEMRSCDAICELATWPTVATDDDLWVCECNLCLVRSSKMGYTFNWYAEQRLQTQLKGQEITKVLFATHIYMYILATNCVGVLRFYESCFNFICFNWKT